MPRAALTSLGLSALALAGALGCASAAPPAPPTPAASEAPPAASTEAPPAPKLVLKENEPIPEDRIASFVEACAAGKLDDATTASVVQRLAAAHDRRGEPCFLRALRDYRPEVTEETVGLAAGAVEALSLKSASGPLFEVFRKIHASRSAARRAYREVAGALEVVIDPAWEPQLIAALDHPVDPRSMANLTDEMYWQITAAKLLGLMKSQAAVKPLIKVILSPAKAAGQVTALLALVKIGRPAIGPATALLNGTDKDLGDYAREEQRKAATGDLQPEKVAASTQVAAAALILATLGQDEAAAPLLDAVAKADDVSRAFIARELTKLPRSPATVKAFEDAFEKTPPALTLPPPSGQGAREALLEASTAFFDADLVPFIVKSAKKMTGTESILNLVREASLLAALKLALPEQWNLVEDLAKHPVTVDKKRTTIGAGFEKEMTLTKELFARCGKKVDCYLDAMTDVASQGDARMFAGIKAAYMVGVLGSPADKPKIVAALPKLTGGATRFLAAQLIDFWSPKGDPATASALQRIVTDAERAQDANMMRLNALFPTVIYRLNARAQ